jgi:hypothetical protein
MKKIVTKINLSNGEGYNVYINIQGNGHSSNISFDQDTEVIPVLSVSSGDYSIGIHVVTDGQLTIDLQGMTNITPPLPAFNSTKQDYLGDGQV